MPMCYVFFSFFIFIFYLESLSKREHYSKSFYRLTVEEQQFVSSDTSQSHFQKTFILQYFPSSFASKRISFCCCSCLLLFLLLFSRQDFSVQPWLSYPGTQKSACLCLPSAGIKGIRHHAQQKRIS